MLLSKSFGYALRGILYLALTCEIRQRIQVDEIARELGVPKHFLSKIMKKIVKHGILNSSRGPNGGFFLSEKTLSTSLFELIQVTTIGAPFEDCVLRFRKCNSTHPCPLHHRMETFRHEFYQTFTKTTIGDLLNADRPGIIRSISTQ
jgi:Rrf2 family transcriptional regulator, iron-sulfur cluster assembly transcription factor